MNSQTKLDLYKLNKSDYVAIRKPSLVTIAKTAYLSIKGQGAPGGESFQRCIGALYGMAYTIKMTRKFAGKGDYAVCKLEAIYWTESNDQDFCKVPMEQWRWKMMIRTPDCVGEEDLRAAREGLAKKGKTEGADQVQLELIEEGLCVQMLHVGPYDRTGETIAVMKEFVAEKNLRFHKSHHEIYLSDPRRVAPEKLKTIMRCPVTPA